MALARRRRTAERVRAWLAASARPAPIPTTRRAQRGRDVFLQAPCAMCHTIRGTSAGATHGARPHAPREPRARSRAGTLPNTRGHLAGLDRRSAAASSPATGCRRPGSTPTTCRRWSPTWRRCSDCARSCEPATASTRGARARARPWRDPGGLIGWLAHVDHKSIGRRYIVTAFVFFVARRHCSPR